jgi:hypothetical protein
MLDEDRHEALERAEDGAMDHDRALAGAVLGGVVEIEALRLVEVDLNRRALMASPEGVLDVKVDLRSVEGAVAGVHLVAAAGAGERLGERLLRMLPVLLGPHRLRGLRRQLDPDPFESELAVDLAG